MSAFVGAEFARTALEIGKLLVCPDMRSLDFSPVKYTRIHPFLILQKLYLLK